MAREMSKPARNALSHGANSEADGYVARLVVVDDNDQVRRLVCRWLRRRGCEVLEFTNGPDAIAGIESAEGPLDAVLLDVMMPGMSGVEVLTELRTRYSASDLPVVMLTARSESSLVVQALEAGANDYVTKPIDLAVLMARLTSHVTRKRVTVGLKEREQRFELAVSGSGEGIWDWDIAKQSVFVSGPWCALLGLGNEPRHETPDWWLSKVHPADLPGLKEAIHGQLSGTSHEQLSVEHRIQCVDGSYKWVRTRGQAQRDGSGRAVRIAGALSDVAGQPLHDPVTGLPGRRYFEGRLGQAHEAGAHFAVICLSSDLVSTVTDSIGSEAGMDLQRTMAERLVSAARAYDGTSTAKDNESCIVASLGQGQFAVLCHPRERRDEASELAACFRHELTKPVPIGDDSLRPNVLMGLAYGPARQGEPEQTLSDARVAMNRATTTGGAATYDGAMRTEMVDRLRLEGDLSRALKNEEFHLE
ncbi:MAG: PAS domain S-box-containing protein, partial [Myxococcota bacterium]